MNIKLNLKVLKQMDEDFDRIILQVAKMQNEQTKEALMKEIAEKKRCIRILFEHYKAVLENTR